MTTVLRFTFLVCAILGSIGASRAAAQPTTPRSPVSFSGQSVIIDAIPVPLNPEKPSEVAIGDFVYAGGVVLTSKQTGQLHGLSDIEVTGGNKLTAVGDFGILLEARLVFDASEKLIGVADASIAPLLGEDGKPLINKVDADAEGLAILPNGDRLVSFERRHRILRYPADGGPPHEVPMPAASFRSNSGMEALTADPDTAPDAYIVGSEATGEIWTCRVSSTACVKAQSPLRLGESGLAAMRRLPGMRSAYLLRAFDATRGVRISLLVTRGTSLIARMDITPPMTVDNFEGLAAVPRPDGKIRFYLMSDDNAVIIQRTILLAFDWQPR